MSFNIERWWNETNYSQKDIEEMCSLLKEKELVKNNDRCSHDN